MEHEQSPSTSKLNPEAEAAAEAAARAAGLSIEDWVSRTILNTVQGAALAVGVSRTGKPNAPPAIASSTSSTMN